MGHIVAILKPKGPTSHDIVDAIRRITGERRVGHAGTLDPLAEGVLVVAIGRDATKTLASIVAKEKEYLATIQLGATSSTDDTEGEIVPLHGTKEISLDDIESALKNFIGTIAQIPPAYSAIKIKGTPAHRRVRRGEHVELPPRDVHIKNIELIHYAWPELELRIVCGPGTYIRSLARDIGAALKVGGYLAGLIRTRVGTYRHDTARTLEQLAQEWPMEERSL
jgi:tRNA pseudouridine55 synthase